MLIQTQLHIELTEAADARLFDVPLHRCVVEIWQPLDFASLVTVEPNTTEIAAADS